MSVHRWMARLYNRISSTSNDSERRKRNLQANANMNSPSSSFCHNELGRALSEQSFGLTRYEVTREHHDSAHEAAAAVTLLEGTNIRVYLNTRGYRLDDGQTYESIEALLQSISPMYVQKRVDMLVTKLQGLQ